MGINLLLAAVVAVSGSSATVTNDTDQTVTATVQVYDGQIVRELAPGQSYTFDDLKEDRVGSHWAVWINGELAANGVFEAPAPESPSPKPADISASAPTVTTADLIVGRVGRLFAV